MHESASVTTDVVLGAGQTGPEIRELVLSGALVLFAPTPETLAFAAFARELLEEAFHPHHPPEAQHHLDIPDFARILAAVKPRFIHHDRSWELMADAMASIGLDDGRLYADVPRVRMATSGDHLKVGIAHAQPAHRDTWWGSPFAQVNFWGPIYPMATGTGMDFHPAHFDRKLANSSEIFDVQDWQQVGRVKAVQEQGDVDKRGIPEPQVEPDGDAISITLPVGGLIAFSAAHLHATAENDSGRSRVSLDFRVVSLLDLEAGNGPANLDSDCTGTALVDFKQIRTREPLPPSVFEAYGHPELAQPVPAG